LSCRPASQDVAHHVARIAVTRVRSGKGIVALARELGKCAPEDGTANFGGALVVARKDDAGEEAGGDRQRPVVERRKV